MSDADVNQLIEMFPGSIEIGKLNSLPEYPGDMYRAQLKRRILDNGWVPFAGASNDSFTVVGEAPGYYETKYLKPFVGASGHLLRERLKAVGLDPDLVFYANVVPFWPTNVLSDETRAPSDTEIRLHRELFMEVLSLPRSQFVLLLGATALKAFRPDLKLYQAHGHCFVWNEKWVVMPTYHPAAALRNPTYAAALDEDLRKWARSVGGHNGEWHRYIDLACVRCGAKMKHMDGDAVAWCDEHWDRGSNARLAKTYWNGDQPEQLSLL